MSAQKQQNYVSITIRDTGIGIPDEQLPRIFDRFYRVNDSGGEKGFGLGLSIANSIAQAHGGKISVVSQPQQGSTFTVYLPAQN